MIISPLTKLRKQIGRYAVDQLRANKATLNIWRGSTPHNTYVESKVGNMLWHSEDWEKPDMSLFELVGNSKESIAYSWVHSEGGMPFKSIYCLKKEYRKKENRK